MKGTLSSKTLRFAGNLICNTKIMKKLFIHLAEIANYHIDNSVPSEVVFTFPAGVSYELFKDITTLIVPIEGCDFGDFSGVASSPFTVSFHRYKLREFGIICADTVDSYVTGNLTNQTLESEDIETKLQKDVNSFLFIIGNHNYVGNKIRTNTELWNANNSFMLYRWICLKADIPNDRVVYYLTHEPLALDGGKFITSYICSLKTSYADFNEYFANSDEKRAMLKSQLFKNLSNIENAKARTAWLFSNSNFDTLFEKTKLAYDRYCLRYGEDRLAAQLEKESLDIIERVKGIGESLKAELIVLATNALGFSAVEFESNLTGKTLLIFISIMLINTVFQLVLCNGYGSLRDLMELIRKRRQLMLDHNPDQQHKEINTEFKRLEKKTKSSKRQFVFSSIILWVPIVIGLIIFFCSSGESSQAVIDFSLKIFS